MTRPASTAAAPERPAASWKDYLALARPSHVVKHLFILPGIVLALLLHGGEGEGLGAAVAVGFASAVLVASANYVLNEWLDARFDIFHPSKSLRPAVAKRLSPLLVAAEYLALAGGGLALAQRISPLFLGTSLLFLVSAWAYNVSPVRTKDRAYLDVVSESFNNPIRLTLGWAMVDSTTLPPGSLLAAYWMGGAFLMAVKRLAEYRTVTAAGRGADLARYRRSFRFYDESKLLTSSLVYSLLAGFFLAVFLVKYRIEYLLSLPLFAALFGVYLSIGLRPQSAAQAPEQLFRERRLMVVVLLLLVALVILTWVDIPVLQRLTDPHYIRLPAD